MEAVRCVNTGIDVNLKGLIDSLLLKDALFCP